MEIIMIVFRLQDQERRLSRCLSINKIWLAKAFPQRGINLYVRNVHTKGKAQTSSTGENIMKKKQNPFVWGLVSMAAVFILNTLVIVGAWVLEYFVQTWAGFGLLALGVMFLAPLTVGFTAYLKSNSSFMWGLSSAIAVFVWNTLVIVGAWVLEYFVQTWAGFGLLALGVMFLAPLTVGFTAYYLAQRINTMPEEELPSAEGE